MGISAGSGVLFTVFVSLFLCSFPHPPPEFMNSEILEL